MAHHLSSVSSERLITCSLTSEQWKGGWQDKTIVLLALIYRCYISYARLWCPGYCPKTAKIQSGDRKWQAVCYVSGTRNEHWCFPRSSSQPTNRYSKKREREQHNPLLPEETGTSQSHDFHNLTSAMTTRPSHRVQNDRKRPFCLFCEFCCPFVIRVEK